MPARFRVVGGITDDLDSRSRDASKPLTETGQSYRDAAALLPSLSDGDIPDYGDGPLWFHPLLLGPYSAMVLPSSRSEQSVPNEGTSNPHVRIDQITQRKALTSTPLAAPRAGGHS